MRILNVFIKNLNSLAGEWFIDFEHPDLQSENLFLISGPTGSGKTTLLDAICLALYGCTPRLGAKGSANITPIQEIISRHTKDAMAEVVFETRRGRFRASWSQKYADSGKGKRLSFIHSLGEYGGMELSRKTTQTVKLVTELTGLSYSEFTRAVLLAQGGFAAFLTTSREEKGKLLEKLADTKIYRTLSATVFAMQKKAREAKDLLQKEFDLLPKPESAEVEEKSRLELKEIDKEIANLENYMDNIRLQMQNLENLSSAKRKVDEIRVQIDKLNDKKLNFAEKATRLEMAIRLQPADALFIDYEKARARMVELEKSLAENRVKYARKEVLTAELERRKQDAEESQNVASSNYDAKLPIYMEARKFDSQIREAKENLDKVNLEYGKAKAEEQELALKMESSAKTLQKLKNEGASLRDWLEKNSKDEWLVENISAVKERFKNLENLEEKKVGLQKQLDEVKNRLASQMDALKKLSKELEKSGARTASLEKADQEAGENLARILDADTIEDLRLALREAQKKINMARLSASLAEQRAMLVEGEPCPLCGAVHHPWQDGQLPPHFETLEVEEKALENRIANAEKATQEWEKIRKELEKARNEEQARRDKADSYGQVKSMLEENYENLRLEFDKAVRGEEDYRETIKNDLVPLGLKEEADSRNLLPGLESRRNAWMNKVREEQETGAAIKDEEAELLNLKEKWTARQENIKEKEARLAELDQIIEKLKQERFACCEDSDVDQAIRKITVERDRARQNFSEISKEAALAKVELAALEGANNQLEKQGKELAENCRVIQKNFQLALKNLDLAEEEFHKSRMNADEIKNLSQKSEELRREGEILEDRLDLARENVKLLEKNISSGEDGESLKKRFEKIREEQESFFSRKAGIAHNLEIWDKNRESREKMLLELQDLEKTSQKWSRLSTYIGSSKGDEFAQFAQNITLNLLIRHANYHLASLNSRYQLARSCSDNLGLVVIDTFQANEQRPVGTLSGGETFLVSLALALGLSALSGKKAELGSLFLDEGFGSLDNETLDTVMTAIYNLRDSGRMIGVISHVEQMKQRISEKLEVRPIAGGQSELLGKFCSRARPRHSRGE